jgi:PAS domain S-box-containing protein
MPTLDTKNPEQIAKELYKRNLELHLERKRTAELLYRVSEAIYATDMHCNLTLFNHTLEVLLEKQPEEVLGKHISEVLELTDEKGNPLDITIYCSLDEKEPKVPPLAILKTPHKDRYVHIKISTIETTEDNKEFLVTMSDVTREKELEKTKDEFISITSHELRTPMSIIKSYLWMLATGRGGTLTEKQHGYLDKAIKGTERMLALINDMLSVSRIEQGKIEFKKEDVNLSEFFQDVVEELDMKAKEKSLCVNLTLPTELASIYTDKQKLREIIINLAGNSIKFTDSGCIEIKIEKQDENFAKISVIDTGRGIDPAEIPRLFHKFQRLDNSYQTVAESGGTGLGLYIVKLYLESLGGKIEVESEGVGKGATFWFTLPLKVS